MRERKRIPIKEQTWPIYVMESNTFGIILSLLFWLEKFVTQTFPFNFTCKTSTITNWWWPEILTFSKTASMFITLELLCFGKSCLRPCWGVLYWCSLQRRILRKTRALHAFPNIVVRGPGTRHSPCKVLILLGAALPFEKLGQKSGS